MATPHQQWLETLHGVLRRMDASSPGHRAVRTAAYVANMQADGRKVTWQAAYDLGEVTDPQEQADAVAALPALKAHDVAAIAAICPALGAELGV